MSFDVVHLLFRACSCLCVKWGISAVQKLMWQVLLLMPHTNNGGNQNRIAG